jgi:hypothetical protein
LQCPHLSQAAGWIVSECANADGVKLTKGQTQRHAANRWSGQYYGFIANGYYFHSISNYCGWVERDGTIWRSDGKFLGDFV